MSETVIVMNGFRNNWIQEPSDVIGTTSHSCHPWNSVYAGGKSRTFRDTDLATQLERVPQQLSHRKELRVDFLACPCLSKWLLPVGWCPLIDRVGVKCSFHLFGDESMQDLGRGFPKEE